MVIIIVILDHTITDHTIIDHTTLLRTIIDHTTLLHIIIAHTVDHIMVIHIEIVLDITEDINKLF
jgi:hypothetical protein